MKRQQFAPSGTLLSDAGFKQGNPCRNTQNCTGWENNIGQVRPEDNQVLTNTSPLHNWNPPVPSSQHTLCAIPHFVGTEHTKCVKGCEVVEKVGQNTELTAETLTARADKANRFIFITEVGKAYRW